MTHQDFLSALSKKFKIPTEELLKSPLNKHKHALNVVYRGTRVIEKLKEYAGVESVEGLHALDIGCGYGGVIVEFAKRGAHGTGIDLNANNLEIAKLYAKDAYDIDFYNIRADSYRLPEVVGENKFDIVVLTSVLEHIYELEDFAVTLDKILKPGGYLYFHVPNHQSFHALNREPHVGVYGVSVLSPDAWAEFDWPSAGTFHRPLELYEKYFLGHGFNKAIRIINTSAPEDTKDIIRSKIIETKKILEEKKELLSQKQFATLSSAVHHHLDNLEVKIKTESNEYLYYRYVEYDHTVIIQKPLV